MDRDIYVPPQGPPQKGLPRDIYARMGEENIFRMLSDFYEELEKSPIRSMFPADMREASKKSAKFFVQLLGGPPLYAIDHGPPRMRARHIPFPIDDKARQVWLGCFERILGDGGAKYAFPPEHLDAFREFLRDFSAWMVNKAG
ncbi:MAG TPA: hypothetical protein VHE12_14335 [bacterium]|nr:hypothetical protein [bacterium]